jgi:hypothetical protein
VFLRDSAIPHDEHTSRRESFRIEEGGGYHGSTGLGQAYAGKIFDAAPGLVVGGVELENLAPQS